MECVASTSLGSVTFSAASPRKGAVGKHAFCFSRAGLPGVSMLAPGECVQTLLPRSKGVSQASPGGRATWRWAWPVAPVCLPSGCSWVLPEAHTMWETFGVRPHLSFSLP